MTKTTNPPVTVYTKDDCRQCDATKRWLETRDIPFTVEDLTEPGNLAAAKELGHMQAPVIIVGNHHWSGFNPTELEALKARRESSTAAASAEKSN